MDLSQSALMSFSVTSAVSRNTQAIRLAMYWNRLLPYHRSWEETSKWNNLKTRNRSC
jgi:hypothetical protein